MFKRNLSEAGLSRLAKCSWDDSAPSELERISLDVLAEAAVHRMGNYPMGLAELREAMLKRWNAVWEDRSRTKEYWVGPRACAGFARRVYELFDDCSVIQPFQPYKLKLSDANVTGSVALLGREDSRGRLWTYVLSPCLRPARDKRVPNYVALARWLSVRRESDHVELPLMNVPLLIGNPWIDKDIDETLAETWLTSIVRREYIPVPGSWCRTCSHPCKGVFHG